MTEGLLAVAAVVALSMTVLLVPVVFDDTVLELLETVLELLETVIPVNAKNNVRTFSVLTIF